MTTTAEITSTRNSHEQLADAEAEIRCLKEQLEQMKPYMKHRFHCVWHKANCQNKCTCGLKAILEKDDENQ
jgi:hypothetical protein